MSKLLRYGLRSCDLCHISPASSHLSWNKPKGGVIIKMQTFTTKTVREIALASPETTRVFEAFKIDYCCGGKKLFADACVEHGLDPGMVAEKIEAVLTSPSETNDQPEFKAP